MINNNVGRKVDAIFYNENRAVIVDWKFSPYSVNEQVYMNEGSYFNEQLSEVKKCFNYQKEVTLLIVPLKRVIDCMLLELSSEDVETLQREQIGQDIFYQTKYKRMRNQILSKHFNIHQKCALGEGKKQNMTLREYLLDIMLKQKKYQLEYYGNHFNCYGKHPPNNKEHFWALHVLIKEIQKNNERIIALVQSQPNQGGLPQMQLRTKPHRSTDSDELDFIAMVEKNCQPVLTKQNSSQRHKYRQNKTVLQFIVDQINKDYFVDNDELDAEEDEYQPYDEDQEDKISPESDNLQEQPESENPQEQNESDNLQEHHASLETNDS